jgi:hypothetical protein
MNKSWNSREFINWNLIKTGEMLRSKFASNPETMSNVFIVRADYFHLKSFAK